MKLGAHKINCPTERQKRREGMFKLYITGVTYTHIANRYNCSVSNAYATIKRYKSKLERVNKMSGETKQRLTDLEVENARLRNERPTLRDQFAMAALTGMLAKGQTEDRNGFYLAKESYRIANAMMEARNGTQN